jgi:hypothetical protein
MTLRSERRTAELAVIEAARKFMNCGTNSLPWLKARNALGKAVEDLDALDLVDPGKARHSRGAPLTSENAASYMEVGPAKSLAQQVMRQFYLFPASGWTVAQLVERLRRPHQSVSARVNELRDLGWVENSGLTRSTTSGRSAVIWKITDQALNMMRSHDRHSQA